MAEGHLRPLALAEEAAEPPDEGAPWVLTRVEPRQPAGAPSREETPQEVPEEARIEQGAP